MIVSKVSTYLFVDPEPSLNLWTLNLMPFYGSFGIIHFRPLNIWLQSCSLTKRWREKNCVSCCFCRDQRFATSINRNHWKSNVSLQLSSVLVQVNLCQKLLFLHLFFSYCGLVDARISASEKDLPIALTDFESSAFMGKTNTKLNFLHFVASALND